MAKTSLEHLLEAAKKQSLKSLVVEQLKEARFCLEQVVNRTQKKKSGWQNIVPETDKWQQLTERTRYLQTDTWEKFTIEEKNGRFWHSESVEVAVKVWNSELENFDASDFLSERETLRLVSLIHFKISCLLRWFVILF